MKIKEIRINDKYLIIHTNLGERKITLNSPKIDIIEAKCKDYMKRQCEISLSSFGDWDPNIWFSDISEITDFTENKKSYHEYYNWPLSREFKNKKSTKIFGPPGTGKTSTLINYVKEAIKNGIEPNDIAFIAFSNEAANVASARVKETFKEQKQLKFFNFSTMHSLATKIIGTVGYDLMEKKHYNKFDINIKCWYEWTIIADEKSKVLRYEHPIIDEYSKSIARKKEIDFQILTKELKDRNKFNSTCNILGSYFKENFYEIESNFKRYCKKYIKKFERFKKENSLITFDDVISNVSEISFPDHLMPTFEVLIIDEAQDLSKNLWKFGKKLIEKAKISYIAGDDDQSINIGLGADPETFISLETTNKDIYLQNSFRVTLSAWNYINSGIIPIMDKYLKRLEKNWRPQKKEGNLKIGTTKLIKDETNRNINSTVSSKLHIVKSEISIIELIKNVEKDWHEFEQKITLNTKDNLVDNIPDWLIMAPTKNTGKLISEYLIERSIPHFLRNKPELDADIEKNRIRVQTIHISKGAEAKNVAIVFGSFGDVITISQNPRLAYVALSRSKESLYPRVMIDNTLLDDMANSKIKKYIQSSYIFDDIFPLIEQDDN